MIDRRLLEVAAARGMAATAVQTEARTSQVSFEFNRLKGLEDTEELSTVLQVIRDGKLGLAGSTRPDGMTDLVDAAAEVAEFGAPVTYELPAPAPAARLAARDPRLATLTVDEMIGYGERITSFLRRLHPDLQVMVIMEREAQHRAISNTAGLQAAWDRTTFEMYVGAEMIRGKDFLAISDGIATTTADFDLAALLQGLAEDFTAAQQVVSLEQGNYPVLFRPAAFSELISPLLACLDGGAVVRGVSPLGGRLGEAMLAPSLTVVEDGILDGGYGSRMYDDQGVACRRTPLIEAGVLREFLLDLDSAARLGRQPIGTGGMTRPRPNNILVLPGDTSWRAMVAGMRRGIMIAQSIGAWAGNPYSGQVSGSIGLGYLIEDGQIQGRIKDCMFNLNVFTHLRTQLQALSSETKVLGGQVLPWALIDGVSLATRGS